MLNEIIADKIIEIERRKRETPLSVLQGRIARRRKPLDFAAALVGDGIRLVAEVKRASPSKGVLCPDLDAARLAKTYADGGAAAISVLTDGKYFQGGLADLSAVRKAVKLPLLRKDFIIEPYQVYESAAYGADALLLIVAVLDQARLEELLALSRSLGLSCLVEVHNETELEKALASKARIIGINNRDLKTFKVDISTTGRLRPLIPPGRIVVAESGIGSGEDVRKMKMWGVNAVLVGEALVTAPDIPAKIRELGL